MKSCPLPAKAGIHRAAPPWVPAFAGTGGNGTMPRMKRKTSRTRIARASAEEVSRRIARGEGRADWKRDKAMKRWEGEPITEKEEGELPKGWEKNVVLG